MSTIYRCLGGHPDLYDELRRARDARVAGVAAPAAPRAGLPGRVVSLPGRVTSLSPLAGEPPPYARIGYCWCHGSWNPEHDPEAA